MCPDSEKPVYYIVEEAMEEAAEMAERRGADPKLNEVFIDPSTKELWGSVAVTRGPDEEERAEIALECIKEVVGADPRLLHHINTRYQASGHNAFVWWLEDYEHPESDE